MHLRIIAVTAAVAAAALAAGCSEAPDGGVGAHGDALENVTEAQTLLYEQRPAPAECATGAAGARVECLLSARYAEDPGARDIALTLFRESGSVAGVLPAQKYDGGYRGELQLVPALPIGESRDDLEWVRAAMHDIEGFFHAVTRSAHAPVHYRWHGIDVQFFRSVGRTTPSAFASDDNWRVAYNVSGSLNRSAPTVRETIFHELFHMNDWAHHDWYARALAPIVKNIIVRCGTSRACLKPFTPTDVVVPGGTYYAFQPGPPTAIEYAAELAVRYHDEQRARIDGRSFAKPAFKCGPPENARSWALLVDEFFGGADLVPPCGH